MNYSGKLYGKIGDRCFDTGKTSEDWDKLIYLLNKCLSDNYNSSCGIGELRPGTRDEIETFLKKH